MPRELNTFFGDAAVIGCTNDRSSHCGFHGNLHPTTEDFYCIDGYVGDVDYNFNIHNPLPSIFHKRFSLTMTENLDSHAYNEGRHKDMAEGKQGFLNLWNMTRDNGFILLVGCPPQKEFRRQIYCHQLKYIELDQQGESILIPKNQNLSIEKVKKLIRSLNPKLQETIERAKNLKKVPHTVLNYCTKSYETLPLIYEENLKKSLPAHLKSRFKNLLELTIEPLEHSTVEESEFNSALQPAVNSTVKPVVNPAVEPVVNPAVEPVVNPAVKSAVNPGMKPAVNPTVKPINDLEKIEAFKKIYKALYMGQTSLFKKERDYSLSYTLADIEAYSRKKPHSRTAKAYHLTQIHSQQVNPNNLELIKEIHRYSYQRSSTFVFFKRTVNFAQYDREGIPNAAPASRTGKILRALM